MPPYYRLRWVFGLAFLLLMIAGEAYALWWPAIVVGTAWIGLLVWGSASIRARFFVPSVCEGPPDRMWVALTFDDGPEPEMTKGILDILSRERVPAAFFCIGRKIIGREAILGRMLTAGHLVGNHGFAHSPGFDWRGSRHMLRDLRRMDEECRRATGRRPRFFRPPYGVTNPNLARAIREGGYVSIGWTLRSLDTVSRDPDRLLKRLLDGLKPGAIILLHDTIPLTREILPSFIRQARMAGYEFVRLDQMIQTEAYA